MEENLKTMEILFSSLNEQNQEILIMVANGMNLAQANQNTGFNATNSNEINNYN